MVYFFLVSIQSSSDNCCPISLNGSTPLPTVGSGTSGGIDSTWNPGVEHMPKAKSVNILIHLTKMIGSGKVWGLNLEVYSPWSYWQLSGNGGSTEESEIRN